jgi:metal-dependent amidase/aminoacylase/carboxypeptidase family protein
VYSRNGLDLSVPALTTSIVASSICVPEAVSNSRDGELLSRNFVIVKSEKLAPRRLSPPWDAAGKFAVRSGPMMAGGAFFDIDIEGRGAHGARPEAGVDPLLVAAHVTAALQSIVSRNIRPVDTAVVSVTQIHGGNAYNVIPQSARLSGTVRAFSNEVMELIGRNLARVAQGVAVGFGAKAQTDFRPIFAPVVNDAQEADFAAAVCTEIVGADAVKRDPALIMASEDFSFMLNEVRGIEPQVTLPGTAFAKQRFALLQGPATFIGVLGGQGKGAEDRGAEESHAGLTRKVQGLSKVLPCLLALSLCNVRNCEQA